MTDPQQQPPGPQAGWHPPQPAAGSQQQADPTHPPAFGMQQQPGPGAAPSAQQQAHQKAIELVDGEWHRLHPATPLLRGGLALIIVLGILISTFRDRVLGAFVPDEFDEFNDDPFGDFIVEQLLWVLLGVIALVAVAVALFWVAWRVHRFRITGDAVEVEQGILVKKHRRAPLARIQAINIQKPWFARLLGACKFEVQQAGNDSNVDLNYLSSSVADALRYQIMDRASGRSAGDAERLAAERGAAGGASVVDDFLRPDAEIAHLAPDSLVRIPVQRIALSSLLDGTIAWAVAYLVVTLVVIIGFQQWWAVFALLPGAFAFFVAGMKSLGSKLRYSIAATPDGIRLAYGLASTTTEIIPPGRIFALQIKQPLLWRPFGWWQVTFTRAGKMKPDGSGQGGSSQMASYLLPVGDLRDVRTVVGLVLPELAQSPLIDAGLFGQAPDAFVVSPPRARIFRWFSVQRNGFHVHDAAFLLRHGRIWRSMHLVPQARVQSVALQQGPIYGLARLARVQLHVPDTVLSPGIGAIDQGDASTLFEHAMRSIKVAIDRDASESWASALSRNAVLETAPAVQDGLMAPPSGPGAAASGQPHAPSAPAGGGWPAAQGQLGQPWPPAQQQQPWRPAQQQPWQPAQQPQPQPWPPVGAQQPWQPAPQPWRPAQQQPAHPPQQPFAPGSQPAAHHDPEPGAPASAPDASRPDPADPDARWRRPRHGR
ncbi:PH domain-containing protein [Agrococcus lahaulensis]|uniref:PH domain-containing protein n=1 Tax=Agrococcus lahaulensis TaxID=341722 RepID=UPI00068884DC|nr:PH domain-containing protein [Agrococcus lahaulensis]